MRRVARWFLLTILMLDVVFVGLFYLAPTVVRADQPVEPPVAGAPAGGGSGEVDGGAAPDWSRRSLALLAERLQERSRELERRESRLAELDRGVEVLRRAGEAPPETAGSPATPQALDPDPVEEARAAAFERLQRAYENMEPESAALALAELAARDRRAVVELLLGWSPRVSGAILDALTQSNPGLAADLSYEIWKHGGKGAS